MAREERVESLYADVLRAGENAAAATEVLDSHAPDDLTLAALLYRPVPSRFLEIVATTKPWSDRPRVALLVCLNRKAGRSLTLRLLPSLAWKELADVAAAPAVAPPVRMRAEEILLEKLPRMRLGEKISLGRIATRAVLPALLQEGDPRVLNPSLENPRLREEDLARILSKENVPVALLEAVASSRRFAESVALRASLVLHPKTPLPVALAQLTSLPRRELLRVAEAPALRPLLQAAALRVLREAPERI